MSNSPKCCGCSVPLPAHDYISHALTDLPGTDGENWGDTAIMLCEGCHAATLTLERAEDFRQYRKWVRERTAMAGKSSESATALPQSPPPHLIGRHPAPFAYSPAGDSDGETVGVDHFVLDAAGDELACPPGEEVAKLFAASPELLAACEAFERFAHGDYRVDTVTWGDLVTMVRVAVVKAKGK